MPFFRNLLFILSFLSISLQAYAQLPKIKVAVLASGTVNWELEHLKSQELDKLNGFDLEIIKVASMSAAKIALSSDNADTIVADWLWANERITQGEPLRFIPFSKQIGVILQQKGLGSDINALKGARIGIAGGPLNKSWVLLQAAAIQQGVDLKRDADIQFGSPPLLSQSFKAGRLDYLVTFWHYGVRLEAQGHQRFIGLNELMRRLGFESELPMLGYLFKQPYVQNNPNLVAAFTSAVMTAKQQLAENDEFWQPLRKLMKAEDDAVYSALINGYRQGAPKPISLKQIKEARMFYQLIDQLKPYPKGIVLDETLFYLIKQGESN